MTMIPSLALVALGAALFLSIPLAVASASPVVGILTQPHYESETGPPACYYVAASYLKWLEVAGARAIPIPYEASDQEVDEIFGQINAVLFPGGGSDLPPSARRLWNLTLEANANNDYFPIWSTCLGFEYIILMASSRGESIISSGFDSENYTAPLILLENNATSQLYNDSTIQEIVQTNITFNAHSRGLTPEDFYNDTGLTSMFYMTSVSTDRNGRSFCSTIEPINATLHPIYGTQYHPEKNVFEYGVYNNTNIPYEAINHSPKAIFASIHLAQFFGSLIKKSFTQNNTLHEYTQFAKYPLVYTYPVLQSEEFEQKYVISKGSSSNNNSSSTSGSAAASGMGRFIIATSLLLLAVSPKLLF